MSMNWYNRRYLKNKEHYERLFNPDPKNISGRYYGLYYGIDIAATPQGSEYWYDRYYWLAEQDIPNYKEGTGRSVPMSEEDWAFLRSIGTPPDPFVEAEENKEFIA